LHQPDENEAHRRTRNLAALVDLGFERVEEPLTTESVAVGPRLWRVSQSVPAMGTIVMVSILDTDEDRAAQVIDAALAEMRRVVDLLNRFDDASALGVLNAEGRLADAPDELLDVMHRARGVHLLSRGAFDITVTPVIDLFRGHRDSGQFGLPDATALVAAQRRVQAAGIAIDGRQVHLHDGVEITLDGIAKGYVVDRMAAVLEAHGARGYLVNGGGDIRTGGTRDGVQPWRVGVCDPEQTDAELDVLPLTDGAVATSGSYEIYFDRERTRHHIVTAAGVSPGECLGVTVRAATAMLADALATAAFVAGPTAGIRLVESVPGCSCLVVDAHGAQHSSSSWLPGGSHRGAP
jgi:thiamine biosynthesis lipoprotein